MRKWIVFLLLGIAVMGICSIGYLDSQGEIDIVQTFGLNVQNLESIQGIDGYLRVMGVTDIAEEVLKADKILNQDNTISVDSFTRPTARIIEYDENYPITIRQEGEDFYADYSPLDLNEAKLIAEVSLDSKVNPEELTKLLTEKKVPILDYQKYIIEYNVTYDEKEKDKVISNISYKVYEELDYDYSKPFSYKLSYGLTRFGFGSSIIKVTDVSVGVFNQTYYNVTEKGVQLNESLGNGTYTSEVLHLANYTVQIDNITWSNYTPEQTNITVQVRTKNMSIFDGLLAIYDFDGDDLGASTCNDIYGNNDGVIRSGSKGIVQNGYDSRGYDDDGLDEDNNGCQLTGSTDFLAMQNRTVFFRMKMNTLGNSERHIIDVGFAGGWDIIVVNNDMQHRTGGISDSVVQNFNNLPDTTTWVTIWAWYNGSNHCLETNGAESCDVSTGVATASSVTPEIGADDGGDAFVLNASIDNLIIWNRSLTPQERDCVTNNICLTNWTSYTEPTIDNPYKPPTNEVNGTFAQLKFNFETVNSSKTPILYNFSVGYTEDVNIAPVDTCSPDSPLTADHNFDCDDTCVETGTLDCDGNSITTSNAGSGSIIFEQNPVNCLGVTLTCAYVTQKG